MPLLRIHKSGQQTKPALLWLGNSGKATAQDWPELQTYIDAGYDIVSKQAAPTVSWLKTAREDLAAAYDTLNRPEEAAKFRDEAVRVAQAAPSKK